MTTKAPLQFAGVWTWTAFYKSNTVRAILISFFAWLLSMLDAPDKLHSASAAEYADIALSIFQGAGMLWALYARTRQPTPPLAISQKAADAKNATAVPVVITTPLP